MRVAGLIPVLAILFTLALVPTLRAQERLGTEVLSVEIEGAPGSMLEGLPVQSGTILTREVLRTAIQALYDRGGYGRIEVEGVALPGGGTRLIFHVDDPYFFGTVRIQPRGLLERPLSSYLTLPYGQRFSLGELDRIRIAVIAELASEGYFDAGVTPVYTRDPDSRLVSVVFDTVAGPPAEVGRVEFDGGEQTFGIDELADAFDVRSGQPFSSDRVRDGVESLRALFAGLVGRAGFLDTAVEVGQVWNPGSNTVDLRVVIDPGAFTFVDVRGFDLSDERLRELAPVFEEGSVDEVLIEEGRLSLLEYLRRQGYFDARVSTPMPIQVQLDPDGPADEVAIQIIYDVVPGERSSVAAVELVGNTYFPDRELRSRIELSSRGLFGRGEFSPDLMREAESTIRAMYAAQGFSGTEVAASGSEGTPIIVRIEIREGERFTVGRVDVTGNSALTRDEVILAGDVFVGEVYRPTDLEAARREVITRYHNLGYPDVTVQARAARSNGDVGIDYTIVEGERYDIGRIIVTGNTRTRTTVVRRHVETRIREMAPFDPEAILETQRTLYATGLFDRVDVVALAQNRDGQRDVLIHVEDAAPLLLTYGVGIQEGVSDSGEGGSGKSVDLRGTVEISHNNLWGLDRSISARLQAGRREQRFQTTYREPRLFNWDLDGFASFLVEKIEREAYEARRIDFSLQTLYQFANEDNVLLTASFQTVDLQDIRFNPRADSFPDERGTVQVATVGGSWVRDDRNDPINPTRGNYFSGSLQVGYSGYGSEVNFTSLFTQVSLFRPARAAVIAGSARFGWNQPFGKTASLPITERYFAGGSTTLRAFNVDKAGPPGGGNALFLLNLEYRYPIPFLFSGLSGAAFYDTGTVFPGISDFSIGDFTHTAGFGFRYLTPLGPVRVDLGFNLNRQAAAVPGEEGEGSHKFHFTLGHTF
jgi:outer membrane protein assembly complex protein YaeT